MPTIRDVAKKAGVGVATVSRIIAGKGPVSEKTAKKVHKAIKALQYRPSYAARALPSGQTRTIGVYVPVIHGSFYPMMLNTICTTLRDNDLRMMVAIGSDTGKEREETLEGIEFLREHGCDGLIVMATTLKNQEIADQLQSHAHIVFLNRLMDGFRNKCFAPDHVAAGRLAAATLWDAGHRHIAAIEGITHSVDNAARMRGFLNELTHRGADPGKIPVVCGHFSPDGGKAAAAMLLKNHKGFTALFCASDETASGALSYLHQVGISVPGDISVLGYDGLVLSAYTAPPLSTVHIPWGEICVSAVHAVLNDRYGLKLPVKRSFPAKVVWRASVSVNDRAPLLVHSGGKQ
jgi:LacI family transcriptional regulator